MSTRIVCEDHGLTHAELQSWVKAHRGQDIPVPQCGKPAASVWEVKRGPEYLPVCADCAERREEEYRLDVERQEEGVEPCRFIPLPSRVA